MKNIFIVALSVLGLNFGIFSMQKEIPPPLSSLDYAAVCGWINKAKESLKKERKKYQILDTLLKKGLISEKSVIISHQIPMIVDREYAELATACRKVWNEQKVFAYYIPGAIITGDQSPEYGVFSIGAGRNNSMVFHRYFRPEVQFVAAEAYERVALPAKIKNKYNVLKHSIDILAAVGEAKPKLVEKRTSWSYKEAGNTLTSFADYKVAATDKIVMIEPVGSSIPDVKYILFKNGAGNINN